MSGRIALFERPFYFLRHGETDLNARRLIAGSIDTDLTELGRKQALDAAAALAGAPITAIYSSPLKRARNTAEPIAAKLGLPIVVIPELAERHWGTLQGKPRALHRRGLAVEGAETFEEFMERVLRGFAQIDAEVPLIVGHSGLHRVLCRTLSIVEAEAPITNAMPVRFEPLAGGGWKLDQP